jgi:hypothetical protein
MALSVPSNDHKEKQISEMSDIVGGINSNEATVPEMPEGVYLKVGLHA